MHSTFSSVVTLIIVMYMPTHLSASPTRPSLRKGICNKLNIQQRFMKHLRVHPCIPSLSCPILIPLQALRQAVAETVEELKMKPVMMNLVEG